jgi:hypothetical protein
MMLLSSHVPPTVAAVTRELFYYYNATMQGVLSVVSPDSFLPFVPVFLSSVSEPCPYPSYLCLPSRTSFFFVPPPGFTITTGKQPMALSLANGL